MEPELEKKRLRREMIALLKNLPQERFSQAQQRLQLEIQRLPGWIDVNEVLMYHAINGEIDTSILPLMAPEKSFFIPVIQDSPTMLFQEVTAFTEFRKNYLGINEPLTGKLWSRNPQKESWILVPGLAFSANGYRLGRGKGYYDRFIAAHPGLKSIGLAFVEQLMDSIPVSAWDQPVDRILFC